MDLNKSHPPLPQSFPENTLATHEPRSSVQGARYERWCTTREHKKVITTYHGFAKHENEHDKHYVFLPHGPIESTPWGQQCALCGEPNPSKIHLQYHDILKFDGSLGPPPIRSRKSNFEELLRRHKTSNEKIKELLHKWRTVKDKKAYSCGFCITMFRTLSDRTSHIDREHYAKGKHVRDWNDTFVIKGLLLQPEVKELCLKYFHPADPTVMETEISWPPSVIEDLQLRLELMEEAAQDLAIDVIRQANSRGAVPPKSTIASDLTGRIQRSPSAQVPTILGKDCAAEPLPPPNQEKAFVERTEVQHQTYSNGQNTMDISLMPASSPSSNSQLLGTSSGFQDWMNNPVANTTGNPGFMYNTADNAYESAPPSPKSRVVSDDSLFHRPEQVVVNESSSLVCSYLNWPTPSFNVVQPHSFSVPASEATSCETAQVGLYPDNVSQLSLEPSTIAQLPKRKLSAKSAQEANLKAPTQAPVSKYSIHSSRPEYTMHDPC